MTGHFAAKVTVQSPRIHTEGKFLLSLRRARVGRSLLFPEYSTLGHTPSSMPRAFNFRGRA